MDEGDLIRDDAFLTSFFLCGGLGSMYTFFESSDLLECWQDFSFSCLVDDMGTEPGIQNTYMAGCYFRDWTWSTPVVSDAMGHK
jgi:hypothetical protein